MMASAAQMMALTPAQRPSRPSVRLAPLLVAATATMTTMMNTIQPPVCAWRPIHPVSDA